jgi:hypothetical protein
MEGIDFYATPVALSFTIKTGHTVFRIPDHRLLNHFVYSQNIHGANIDTCPATLTFLWVDSLDHKGPPLNRTNQVPSSFKTKFITLSTDSLFFGEEAFSLEGIFGRNVYWSLFRGMIGEPRAFTCDFWSGSRRLGISECAPSDSS